MHWVKKMRKLCIVLITLSILALVGVCSAANWQTITTFTGASGTTTDYFNVPTDEWKLTWSFTPDPKYPEYSSLGAFIYPRDGDIYVDYFDADEKQTSGTIYIHEGSKDYYLKIMGANLQSYRITIEYDTTAIPEYSTIAIVIALALVSISVISIRNKAKN